MVISNPGIISINQAVNLTLTSRPSGPNSSWLCHATRQWRGNKGRSCGRGCGPEKKKRSSRRILNFEGMKAVCLVICAHFTYTSSPGYPQKDGLFHGNSIYKWMSWRDPHDLGNLHIDKNQYIHHIDGILLISSTYITAWLVVSTPLKNITQWEGLSHILWKKVWNHQPNNISTYQLFYIYKILYMYHL